MLFRENFSTGLFSIGGKGGKYPWFYHRHGEFTGRDPKAILSITVKGLSVTIPQFTLTAAGPDDHLKFVFWRNDVDPDTGQVGTKVSPHEELIYEARARAETFGTEKNPFSAPVDDYRLSCGALLSTDGVTRVGCHFFFTATQAFAVYERYLFEDREREPGAFFCFIIPVLTFAPLTEHTYRIAYSRERNTACWWVDGKAVLAIANLGQRLGPDQEQYSVFRDLPGATEPPIPAEHRIFGAGILTMLDAGIRRGQEIVDLDLPGTSRQLKVFGQGGRLVLSSIMIGSE